MAAPANGVAVSLAADPAGAAVVPASVKDSGRRYQRDLRGQREHSYRVTIYGNYGVTKSESLSVVPRVSIEQIVDRVIERERAGGCSRCSTCTRSPRPISRT